MSPEPTIEEALARIDELAARVAELEQRMSAGRPAERPVREPFPAHPVQPPIEAEPSPSPIPRPELWSGERWLALAGGVLVLAGVVFLLALAIGHGWLTPTLQVAFAIAGGAALCALAFYLHARDGRYHLLAQVVAGAGGGAMYLGLTAGTRFYDTPVLSTRVGLVGACLVGALLVGLAVRWGSQPVAGYGIVGAVLAPILVDAPHDGWTLAFGAIALVAACAVIAERGWPWLVQCALWPTVIQLAAYFDHGGHSALEIKAVSFAWLLLLAGAALAQDVRQPQPVLRVSTALTTFTTAGLSFLLVQHYIGSHEAEIAFLLVVSGTYAVAATLLRRRRPGAATLTVWLWTLALIMPGLALSIALGGSQDLAIGLVWLVEAVAFVWLACATGDDLPFAAAGLAGTGSIIVLIGGSTEPSALAYGTHNALEFAIAGLALTAACFLAAHFLREREREFRLALERSGAIALLYTASGLVVTAVSGGPAHDAFGQKILPENGQFALSIFWVALGLGALILSISRRSKTARYTALAVLGGTAAKVLVVDTATLAAGLRVLVLVIVGGVLFAGSYLLSRYESAGEEAAGPQNPPEVFAEPHRRTS